MFTVKSANECSAGQVNIRLVRVGFKLCSVSSHKVLNTVALPSLVYGSHDTSFTQLRHLNAVGVAHCASAADAQIMWCHLY